MPEYPRTYEFSQGQTSGSATTTAYEDISGQVHVITSGGGATSPQTVVKTIYQNNPNPPLEIGDNFTITRSEFGNVFWGTDFTWSSLTFRCTNIQVTEEMKDLWHGRKRLWRIAISGTTASEEQTDTGGGSTLRRTIEVSEEFNGNLERSVAGTLVALRNSVTPIGRITVVAHSETSTPPMVPGNSYTFDSKTYLITRANKSQVFIEQDGVLIKTLWQHTMEGER
jgi:hypothetical protein